MIVFKIKDNRIEERRNEANDYVLQDGEFGFSQEVLKYTLIDGIMTDTTTQADRDALVELELELNYLRQTIAQLDNGNDLAKEIFSFVRKHTGLTTNQKSVLKSLAVQLFSGQIEEALKDWGDISRPTTANKMQRVYDKLKPKFDNL